MINGLSMLNFKAFDRAEVSIGRYTLLAGLNSSGKSSVLQALALLRQSEDALNESQSGGFQLNGELVELGTGRDVLHESYIRSTDEAQPRISLLLTTDAGEYSWSVEVGERDSDLLLQVDKEAGPTSAGPVELFGPGFQYLHADRISPAVTYPRSYEYAVRRGFLGVHGEHTANYLRSFEDRLVEHRALHHPEAKTRRLQDEADAWMQDICPGVNIQTDAVFGTDLVRLSYGFGTGGLSASEKYRPTNVGFGLTYVLPVVVACLTAGPGTLILVENPEAHLHPRGQTAMANLTCAAAAAGGQIIVETHSDHVLNGVRLAVKSRLIEASDVVLHFFRRSAAPISVEIVTPTIGSDGMISDWPDGFFDEWSRSLDRLLD